MEWKLLREIEGKKNEVFDEGRQTMPSNAICMLKVELTIHRGNPDFSKLEWKWKLLREIENMAKEGKRILVRVQISGV